MITFAYTAVMLLPFSFTHAMFCGNGKALSQYRCSEKDTTLQESVSLIGERRYFVRDTDYDNHHGSKTDHKVEGEKKNVQ